MKARDWVAGLLAGFIWLVFVCLLFKRARDIENARDEANANLQHNTESIEKIEKLLNLHGYYLHEVE